MGSLIKGLLCVLVNVVFASAYKAGALQSAGNLQDVTEAVSRAGIQNLDILVLPSDIGGNNGYDETIQILSKSAKQSGVYLVAHLKESVRCGNKWETVRSNLVFDRNGDIIADYRKSETTLNNCTKTSTEPATFATDVGTFTVMMEEDLVLIPPSELKGTNIVVTGEWTSSVPFLSASKFAASWAYKNNINLITSHGIYAGKAGSVEQKNDGLMVANTESQLEASLPVLQSFPIEDLNQYIIKPLDLETSSRGYSDTVCHNNFCCNFYIKTGERASADVSFGLAVLDGHRHYGKNKYIGLQNCGIVACAGLYKRSCDIGSIKNNTNVIFEELRISANFTKGTAQYPIILANRLPTESFSESYNNKEHTISLKEANSVLTFGIISRDFERDYESLVPQNVDGVDYYSYIFNEDVQEFFDYVWIRLRILIVVVSIYVLEMM